MVILYTYHSLPVTNVYSLLLLQYGCCAKRTPYRTHSLLLHHTPPLPLTCSELACEESGGVESNVLREDVFREDVDQERYDGEGEGHLVDEVEGYELRHCGLDRSLITKSSQSRRPSTARLCAISSTESAYHVPSWSRWSCEPLVLEERLLLLLGCCRGRLRAEGCNSSSSESHWPQELCLHLQRRTERSLCEHLEGCAAL